MYHREKIRHTKLKDHVPKIREDFKNGKGIKEMAREYSCHEKSIYQVVMGDSYRDVIS